jgi:hypothetical protein
LAGSDDPTDATVGLTHERQGFQQRSQRICLHRAPVCEHEAHLLALRISERNGTPVGEVGEWGPGRPLEDRVGVWSRLEHGADSREKGDSGQGTSTISDRAAGVGG